MSFEPQDTEVHAFTGTLLDAYKEVELVDAYKEVELGGPPLCN